MKLLIVATLVAVGSAARLDHLERSYLPPGNQGFGQNSFGGQQGSGFGGQQPGFGGQQGSGFGGQQLGSGFPSSGINAATSNQYLPPNQGSSFGSGPQRYQNAPQQFGGQGPSAQYGAPQSGFGGQGGALSTQYGAPQSGFQSGAPGFGGNSGSQFGAQSSSGSFGGQGAPGSSGAQYNAQFPSASNQYLPPNQNNQNNFQNIPQQAFDEQTGYHY